MYDGPTTLVSLKRTLDPPCTVIEWGVQSYLIKDVVPILPPGKVALPLLMQSIW